MVEEYGPHIIQVTIESEQASSSLVRPHLDFVIVAAGYKEWLGFVKVYTPYWTVMFFKTINQCAHAVIP